MTWSRKGATALSYDNAANSVRPKVCWIYRGEASVKSKLYSNLGAENEGFGIRRDMNIMPLCTVSFYYLFH